MNIEHIWKVGNYTRSTIKAVYCAKHIMKHYPDSNFPDGVEDVIIELGADRKNSASKSTLRGTIRRFGDFIEHNFA